MKYRKKPVVIEAIHFTEKNKDEVTNFLTCSYTVNFDTEGTLSITIGTLEGEMVARLGDYIIKGVKGVKGEFLSM